MDVNSCSDTYSVSSLSVTNETKEKFDALLKASTTRKKKLKKISNSKEKLLNYEFGDSATTASSENLVENDIESLGKDKVYLNENLKESYILNKFLGNSHIKNDDRTEGIEEKPPIPKPRKNKPIKVKKSSSSTLTQATFEVKSPKIIHKSDTSSSSHNKTYNVENEIGDVLIHYENPEIPKPAQRTKLKIKNKNEDNINKSENNSLCKSLKNSESESKIDDIIELDELSKHNDSLDYISEVKSIKTKKIKGKKDTEQNLNEKTSDTLVNKSYNYEKIIEVIIHKTDHLLLNSLVIHPVVKFYIVDMKTGKYLEKSDRNRCVVFFYENKDFDYISPVMTHAYSLQEKRTLEPVWEETILLNEDYDYLIEEANRLIFFFEIVDFLSFSMVHTTSKHSHKGWHKIAFSFLKVSSPTGSLNIGKKVRLQLYYPGNSKNDNDSQLCEPWKWWQKNKLVKYPSTLYVTVKSLISPTKITDSLRSKTPIQGEKSLCPQLFLNNEFEHVVASDPTSIHNTVSEKSNDRIWERQSYEICKIPNKNIAELNTYDDGCFVAKFSCNGELLACGIKCDDLFCLVVYSVHSFKQIYKFPCHQGLIYDIKWSKDDTLLISASADNTISIITLSNPIPQILPHPSFVYSCDINETNVIASGSYDGIVRIWKQNTDSGNNFQLFQELECHKSYVTSVCFNKKNHIFSADSKGLIIEWEVDGDDWKMQREIIVLELKNTIINQLILCGKEKRMVVNSRDNTIRIIDLKSGCILQSFYGSLNKRMQTFCSITPCGNHIYAGSENGLVQVWNLKTGTNIATYTPFYKINQFLTIHCVEFHPHDNILAITHFGQNLPILLFSYDKDYDDYSKFLNIKEYDNVTSKNSISNSLRLLKMKSFIGKHKNEHQQNDNGESILHFNDVLKKMDDIISINQ